MGPKKNNKIATPFYRPKRLRFSKSKRAGIIFPVTRFHRKLKALPQMPHRIYQKASVYLSASIEYLIAEILELSGNAARDNAKARISPRHLMFAIKTDSELEKLFKKCILPGSGVIPNISPALVDKGSDTAPNPVPVIKKVLAPKARAKNPKILNTKKVYNFDAEDATDKTSKNVTLLNERTLATGQKLKVIQADITNVVADAIVHPTNNSFYMGGEVGSAIARAGGQEVRNLVNELHKTYGNLGVCSAAMSQASGNMLCKNIIHVYSPSWDTMQQVQRIDELTKVVQNILTLAETKNLQSVALPSISSGANGFPKQVAAQTILRAINEHFKSIESNKKKSTIDQVIFVLYDTESVSVYTSELGKLII